MAKLRYGVDGSGTVVTARLSTYNVLDLPWDLIAKLYYFCYGRLNDGQV